MNQSTPVEPGLFGLVPSHLVNNKQVHTHPDGAIPGDSLSFDESQRMDRIEKFYAGVCFEACELETSFRHSGWRKTRQMVFEALKKSGAPESRIERFRCCGACAVVEIEKKTGRPRVRGQYCGDRFCVPCMSARACVVREWIDGMDPGRQKRFCTITQKGRRESVAGALDRFTENFAKLRRSAAWRKAVTGGVAAIEITFNELEGWFHVHAHCIIVGTWVDQDAVREAWRKITGDSFIIKFERPKDPEKTGRYCSKYVGKGIDHSVVESGAGLCDCILALKGRRMLITFGTWYGVGPDDGPEDRGEWVAVGRLTSIVRRAEDGDEWARGVMVGLAQKRQGDLGFEWLKWQHEESQIGKRGSTAREHGPGVL